MRRRLRTWHLALAAAAVAALAVAASTAQEGQPSAGPPSSSEWLAFYADLVEETELRRRVNVLHPNPQSILDGLQAGYVNVRRGNLTFRRRDIVAGSGERIYFTRVYDSRIASNRDFGPGWRLSLAEGGARGRRWRPALHGRIGRPPFLQADGAKRCKAPQRAACIRDAA